MKKALWLVLPALLSGIILTGIFAIPNSPTQNTDNNGWPIDFYAKSYIYDGCGQGVDTGQINIQDNLCIGLINKNGGVVNAGDKVPAQISYTGLVEDILFLSVISAIATVPIVLLKNNLVRFIIAAVFLTAVVLVMLLEHSSQAPIWFGNLGLKY